MIRQLKLPGLPRHESAPHNSHASDSRQTGGMATKFILEPMSNWLSIGFESKLFLLSGDYF